MDFGDQKEKLKSLVFPLGFIFFLSGNVCMLIGGYTHGNISAITEILGIKLATYAITLIPIGGIMVLFALIGCGASLHGSYRVTGCCIAFFSVIAFVKFSISCIVLDEFSKSNIDISMKHLSDLLNQTEIVDTPDRFKEREGNATMYIFHENVHLIHEKLQCCGLQGHEFYLKNGLRIPVSCCDENEELSKYESCPEDYPIFENGCEPLMAEALVNGKTNVGTYLMISSFVEMIICFYVSLLIYQISKNSKKN